MRILSLFSGAGGSCLGWHAAGAEHALCCEWDASAGATLAAAGFPWSPTDLSDPEALRAALSPLAGSVDVLEASPPCQAWSSAGSRLGARDPRNGWPWTWEACDVVGPRWLVAENVPGLLCHRGDCPTRIGGYAEPMACAGCYWSEVVLVEARRRFTWVGWWLLDAADFGVPQHRRRVFLIGGPHQVSPPQPTHGDPATLRQRGLFGPLRLPWVTMREALNLGESAEVIGGGQNPREPGDKRTYRQISDEPSTTVAAEQIGNAGPWVVQHMGGAPRGLEPPAPALGGGGNLMLERPAPCVSAGDAAAVVADKTQRVALFNEMRRRLTVEDVATLQGFPTDHPWHGTQRSRYRQVGNAVPPRLAEVVARAVMGADDDR
jgi:DNA (cytosine-5)-methyltransferase 1